MFSSLISATRQLNTKGDTSTRLFSWTMFIVYTAALVYGSVMHPEKIPSQVTTVNDKYIHFCEYFLLFLCSLDAFSHAAGKKKQFLWMYAFSYCMCVGVFTEFLQSYSYGRSPEVDDLFADGAGAGAALFIYAIYATLEYRKPRSIPNKDK